METLHTVNAGPRTAQAPVCQEVVLIGHHTWMPECVSVRDVYPMYTTQPTAILTTKLVHLTVILHLPIRGFGSSHLETDCFSAWTNASVIPGEGFSFCASPLEGSKKTYALRVPLPNTKEVSFGKWQV